MAKVKVEKDRAKVAATLAGGRLEELKAEMQRLNQEMDTPEAKSVVEKIQTQHRMRHEMDELEAAIAELNPPPKKRSQSACSV